MAPDKTVLADRYQIEAPLGQGGMGCVYLARQLETDAMVAIKEMVPPEPTLRDIALGQFMHEAEMLSALSHPGLPRVHELFEYEGRPYLVMDYIKGRSLDTIVGQEEPVDELMLLCWAEELCEVLDYLHRHDPVVIYRDLKPGNIMLDTEGHLRLIDFGISKTFDSASPETRLYAQCVSPGFTAPEQYGIGTTDARSDIYSLGATLYSMLTQSVPVSAVERAAGSAPLPPLSEVRPDVSARMVEAIDKMMALRPTERPADIDTVRTLLGIKLPADRASTVRDSWRPKPKLPKAPGTAVPGPRAEIKHVNANQLRFACLEMGQGPLLLCLHGFPDTPYTWEPVLPALAAAGYRVVAPYLRGYPPTSLAPDGDYSILSVGQDVLALIEALGSTHAVVVGHDWGAMATYAAASIRPQAVRKMVVLAVPHPRTLSPLALSRSSHFITFQLRDRSVKALRRPGFVRDIYRKWSPGWDVPDDELAPVLEVFDTPGGAEGALGYYWSFGLDATLPGRKMVRDILRRQTSVPTLAMYGQDDGTLRGGAFAGSDKAFTGSYEMVALPGVGHFVHREARDIFLEKTLAFLKR
ncbi:MAG TPA: alpha/beta fold hydrolase [Candidatus Xenobia bacterium]|jgi:pimeloyl-ACP methyl ester carboxylesterase